MRSTVRFTVRPAGSAVALVLSLVLSLVLAGAVTQPSAGSRPDEPVPSRQDVREAQQAAQGTADRAAQVEAALVAARGRLQQQQIAAARAAEEFNGARWRAQQAREAARAAARQQAAAQAAHDAQAAAYADSVVDSYESAPELTALTAVLGSDDFGAALERSTTLENAGDGMQSRHEAYVDSAQRATATSERAATADADARRARQEAAAARDAARTAADAAAAEARAVAAERTALVRELARLQGVTVRLAERRQQGLEQRARDRAAEAARAAHAAAQAAAAQAAAAVEEAAAEPAPEQAPSVPAVPSAPSASSVPSTPAGPSSGARAAIAFARAQIGEPYVWAAAGPDSWDCSGLTMAAWAAGGKSLPHYSVAQYDQSTPIGAGDLRPGDLLFWGSSGSPSSIYHVALYTGDGMMVHAPRTGRDVEEVSMYYWIAPNFFARP